MFALLGNVAFEMQQSFTDSNERHKANYAKHEVLLGRPRLQAMGNDLTEWNISLTLHHQIANPDTSYSGLLAAKESQEAQALVFGSGRFIGWFVIDELSATTTVQDGEGRTLARMLDVKLVEFVGDPNNVPQRPAILHGQQHVSVFAGQAIPSKLTEFQQALAQGIHAVQAVKQTVADIRTTVQALQQLPAHLRDQLAAAPAQATQRMIALLATRSDV